MYKCFPKKINQLAQQKSKNKMWLFTCLMMFNIVSAFYFSIASC